MRLICASKSLTCYPSMASTLGDSLKCGYDIDHLFKAVLSLSLNNTPCDLTDIAVIGSRATYQFGHPGPLVNTNDTLYVFLHRRELS